MIFLSGIGYRILPRSTDRISDIVYRISELDISITHINEKSLDGNTKLIQKTAKYPISDSDIR